MSQTRRTWHTRSTWTAGVALAALYSLTSCSPLTGDDGSTDTPPKGGAIPAASGPASPGVSSLASPSASGTASPEPMYTAPDDWTEPERWTALPQGRRTDESGSQVGFPHTMEGAVAMAAVSNNIAVDDKHSAVDSQMRIFHSYTGPADQSAENAVKIEANARQTDKQLAEEMGVKAGQPLPSGAYVRTYTIGYKIIKKSDNEVSLWLLAREVQKNGETAKEKGSYTRTMIGLQWQAGDWKLTAEATRRVLQDTDGLVQPPIVAPGDAAFNAAGWTAIRTAA
ncbi:hypothetical protein [Streptomyces sp. NBC_01565]|uniref:hypothetical protein n=1 Tax=Streptomyces sp. NBC_01565 TaxID=2975881 RepID=UPI00224D1A1B|nr:hypothetical protein [Streptomyces sp. NBC_01565]MCX4546455.1 hypothetical protein [Streptomyces sp. NBC_01565]